jgi:hypothetical protein
MVNTPITVAMRVQGDAAASTPGGLWRMNFEEGITHHYDRLVAQNANFFNRSLTILVTLDKNLLRKDNKWM